MKDAKDHTQRCQHCGRVGCSGPKSVDIPIQKGHVRRAIQAADAVCAAATTEGAVEPGVMLMTALLLVERLATSHGCDPAVVLEKLSSSFDLKRKYLASMTHCN